MAGKHNFGDLLETAWLKTSGKAFYVKASDAYMLGWGTTVPTDAAAGWMPNAWFLDHDAAVGARLYINKGSATSCSFKQYNHLVDDEYILFGTGTGANGDVTMRWDATNSLLQILPTTTDTGAINIGDGTTDIDLKVFLGAAGQYVEFDVGNARVRFEGVGLLVGDEDHITLGDGSDAVIVWNGSYLEHGPATGLWKTAPSEADPNPRVAHRFFDDFRQAPTDANLIWHETDDGGTGTNAVLDAANGVGTVVTAGADNDHHAIDSIGESWLFASGKKLWFEAKFRLTEANTNESAWWFGLTNTLTTGGLQADALGPLADYDGVLIWKDEGTMSIDWETSNATSQDTEGGDITFVSGQWTRVGFYVDGTATTSVVTMYYDLNDSGTWTADDSTANITLAGLTEMHLVAGVKAGPSNGAETLEIDYIKCVQLR